MVLTISGQLRTTSEPNKFVQYTHCQISDEIYAQNYKLLLKFHCRTIYKLIIEVKGPTEEEPKWRSGFVWMMQHIFRGFPSFMLSELNRRKRYRTQAKNGLDVHWISPPLNHQYLLHAIWLLKYTYTNATHKKEYKNQQQK